MLAFIFPDVLIASCLKSIGIVPMFGGYHTFVVYEYQRKSNWAYSTLILHLESGETNSHKTLSCEPNANSDNLRVWMWEQLDSSYIFQGHIIFLLQYKMNSFQKRKEDLYAEIIEIFPDIGRTAKGARNLDRLLNFYLEDDGVALAELHDEFIAKKINKLRSEVNVFSD
jgi:hypothetical protein